MSMENSEVCTGAFFSTLKEENMELFNNEFNQELCKVCDEMEQRELFDPSYDDELYNHCAMIETQFNQTLQLRRGMKRTSSEENKMIKKPRTEEEASTSAGTSVVNDDKVECLTCHRIIKKRNLTNHFKSNVHKNNLLNSHNSLSNISVIESAFRNRIFIYKIV